ncbi:hypothetical protein [Bradyrhizobium nanningense]|uniref:hypothetical protein n=1 Tax=Bradyrhizobium nanningense TaxID=1325118 RepID=UPI00100887BC|nr:hypothetical protein [Bradyrhizobium nanningense]
MSDSYLLPADPEGIDTSPLERFRSGKVGATTAEYDPEAVFIANDEGAIIDRTESATRARSQAWSAVRQGAPCIRCWRCRPDRTEPD